MTGVLPKRATEEELGQFGQGALAKAAESGCSDVAAAGDGRTPALGQHALTSSPTNAGTLPANAT